MPVNHGLSVPRILYNSLMPASKLILLNGFAASGKSTIAKRYIDNHPLALAVEGDTIIVNIGQWNAHEQEARALMYTITRTLAATHLASGHDVVLPYLLTNPMHADAFKQLALDSKASYYEVLLLDEKSVAVDRLIQRGSWGEPGLPPLTDSDLPVIGDLYDRMIEAAKGRDMITIRPSHGDIEGTYQELVRAIAH